MSGHGKSELAGERLSVSLMAEAVLDMMNAEGIETANRYLGWEVGTVALISLFMGLTAYLPMLLVTVSCSILTLIIRVIRNAFGKVIELQDQVDYTI